MKKNRSDSRNWQEIVGDVVSSRTERGDTVELSVTFNGSRKPSLTLTTKSFRTGQSFDVYITDWLEETPYVEDIDISTGKPYPSSLRSGYENWKDYTNILFIPRVRGIVESAGRFFVVEVNNG